ncbi:hypothetical protein CT0861_01001 [Colletotrichum tofieldiae]|uniref:Clr5 domain-containing protein n=1 Tax=Colletotrichum tofieldiae TaxID=708197 RepID=A0A166WQ49_9PEZI|nr:hypothetical protein CT0861_01001 [Colletotrichum tofieldiae]
MDIPHEVTMLCMPLVTGKPYATDDVWNCHRSIITRLYRDEKKCLKQVKQIMECDYNLYATERMFKTRIKSWGLDKKLKEAEVLRMLQLKQERDAIGKKSKFSIRNQEVDWDRLVHYLNRRPDLRNKFRDFARNSTDAHLDLICRTPSPDLEVSSVMAGPPDLRFPEEMLQIFRCYVEGAFESVWTRQGEAVYGYGQEPGRDRVDKMHTGIGNAIALLERNKLRDAFRILNRSLNSLERLIKEQDPELFYMLSYRTLQLDSEIAEPLIVFIYDMHTTILGPRHPLSLVWSRFRHMSWEVRARVLSMMAINGAQFLGTRLGILNPVVDSALSSTTIILRSLGETNGSDFCKVLSMYATAAETYFTEGDYPRSCECLLEMAGVQSRARHYEPARDALARAYYLIQGSDRGSGSPWLKLELRYYELMSSLFYECDLGQVDEALEYEYKAYKHAEEHFQPGNVRSLRAIRNLIHRCRRAGREEDAEKWCETLLAKTLENEDV